MVRKVRTGQFMEQRMRMGKQMDKFNFIVDMAERQSREENVHGIQETKRIQWPQAVTNILPQPSKTKYNRNKHKRA